jgi:hypothetical protein
MREPYPDWHRGDIDAERRVGGRTASGLTSSAGMSCGSCAELQEFLEEQGQGYVLRVTPEGFPLLHWNS